MTCTIQDGIIITINHITIHPNTITITTMVITITEIQHHIIMVTEMVTEWDMVTVRMVMVRMVPDMVMDIIIQITVFKIMAITRVMLRKHMDIITQHTLITTYLAHCQVLVVLLII